MSDLVHLFFGSRSSQTNGKDRKAEKRKSQAPSASWKHAISSPRPLVNNHSLSSFRGEAIPKSPSAPILTRPTVSEFGLRNASSSSLSSRIEARSGVNAARPNASSRSEKKVVREPVPQATPTEFIFETDAVFVPRASDESPRLTVPTLYRSSSNSSSDSLRPVTPATPSLGQDTMQVHSTAHDAAIPAVPSLHLPYRPVLRPPKGPRERSSTTTTSSTPSLERLNSVKSNRPAYVSARLAPPPLQNARPPHYVKTSQRPVTAEYRAPKTQANLLRRPSTAERGTAPIERRPSTVAERRNSRTLPPASKPPTYQIPPIPEMTPMPSLPVMKFGEDEIQVYNLDAFSITPDLWSRPSSEEVSNCSARAIQMVDGKLHFPIPPPRDASGVVVKLRDELPLPLPPVAPLSLRRPRTAPPKSLSISSTHSSSSSKESFNYRTPDSPTAAHMRPTAMPPSPRSATFESFVPLSESMKRYPSQHSMKSRARLFA